MPGVILSSVFLQTISVSQFVIVVIMIPAHLHAFGRRKRGKGWGASKQEKNGGALERRKEKEHLPARPPFPDFCIRRRTQNSDWLILTGGRMGIELVKTNFRFTERIWTWSKLRIYVEVGTRRDS